MLKANRILKTIFNGIKDNIAQYIRLRFISAKLDLIERLSDVLGYFAFLLIVAFLFFFSFLYFSFGLATWLGTVFHNRNAGMFCTGGIILLVALTAIAFSKRIIRYFAGKLAVILLKKKKEEEESTD